VFHVYYKFGYIVTRILQMLVQCYTYATNLDTVLHVYFRFGNSVTRILHIWIVFHVFHKFDYSTPHILQIWIQCSTYATNLDTVLHVYYKSGYSVNTYATNFNIVFHVYCKFGYNVPRMLQSWRQCSTYATSLNTLRYLGMLILAVFPLDRKPPDLCYNKLFTTVTM